MVNGLESFFFDLCLLGLELVSRKSCSGSFFFFLDNCLGALEVFLVLSKLHKLQFGPDMDFSCSIYTLKRDHFDC